MSFNGTLTNSNTANSSLEAKQKIEYVDIISNMLVEIQNEIYEKQNFLGPKSHSFGTILSSIMSLLSHQLSFINQVTQILVSISDDLQYKPQIVQNLVLVNKEITLKKIESLLMLYINGDEEQKPVLKNNDVLSKLKKLNNEDDKKISIHVSDSPINKSLSEISIDMERQMIKPNSIFQFDKEEAAKAEANLKAEKEQKSSIESSGKNDSVSLYQKRMKKINTSIKSFEKTLKSSKRVNRSFAEETRGNSIKSTGRKRTCSSVDRSIEKEAHKLDMEITKCFYKRIKNVKSKCYNIPVGTKTAKNSFKNSIVHKQKVLKHDLNQYINAREKTK